MSFMKTLFKLTLALAVVAVCGSTASAQKFGYEREVFQYLIVEVDITIELTIPIVDIDLRPAGCRTGRVQYQVSGIPKESGDLFRSRQSAQDQGTERPAEPLSGIANKGFPAVPEDAGRSAHLIYDKAQKAVEKVSSTTALRWCSTLPPTLSGPTTIRLR